MGRAGFRLGPWVWSGLSFARPIAYIFSAPADPNRTRTVVAKMLVIVSRTFTDTVDIVKIVKYR